MDVRGTHRQKKSPRTDSVASAPSWGPCSTGRCLDLQVQLSVRVKIAAWERRGGEGEGTQRTQADLRTTISLVGRRTAKEGHLRTLWASFAAKLMMHHFGEWENVSSASQRRPRPAPTRRTALSLVYRFPARL